MNNNYSTKWYYATTNTTTWTDSFQFQWKAPTKPQALCATCGHPVPDRDVVEHADLHAAATLAAP